MCRAKQIQPQSRSGEKIYKWIATLTSSRKRLHNSRKKKKVNKVTIKINTYLPRDPLHSSHVLPFPKLSPNWCTLCCLKCDLIWDALPPLPSSRLQCFKELYLTKTKIKLKKNWCDLTENIENSWIISHQKKKKLLKCINYTIFFLK